MENESLLFFLIINNNNNNGNDNRNDNDKVFLFHYFMTNTDIYIILPCGTNNMICGRNLFI